MFTNILTWNGGLGNSSRLPLRVRESTTPISGVETVILLASGMIAGMVVSFVEFKLRTPGHSILRASIPLAFGLASVPRSGAGTVMGAGAALSIFGLSIAGWGDRGLGAMTSLFLLGPCLDLAMRRASSGRRVYVSFAVAGITANLLAMLVQLAAKSAGWKISGTGKSIAEWLPRAAVSYPLCGAAAGLIGAAIWFRWNSSQQKENAELQQ